MTQHHRTAEWKAFTARMRPRIAASLPRPCIDCPRLVLPTDTWHVGHITAVATAKKLGWTTAQINSPQNVGPSHAHCNTSTGGTLGAKTANANRKAARRMPRW
jgi:hypothetical protein